MESTRERIAEAMARLHGEYYGQPPSEARAFIAGDVVVVVLEETFSQAEILLIGHGEDDAADVRRTRRRFQDIMAPQFVAIVEQATGRCVRSFVSDSDVRERLAIETFVLGDARTDLEGYEEAG